MQSSSCPTIRNGQWRPDRNPARLWLYLPDANRLLEMKIEKIISQMRCIASRCLALAFLFGTAFAQQPTPSDVSERERILLERIERLERRVNELESRLGAATAREGSGVDQMESPRQLTNPTPPNVAAQNTTASQAQLADAALQGAAAQQQT